MTSEHIALRKAAEMALEALDMDSEDADKISWERLAKIVAAGTAMREALAQHQIKKCEAGPSLQNLWDCWDAVHGVGQEPVAWIRESDLKLLNGDLDCCLVSATRDFTDRVPLYLHPAPIPEGWQLVPEEPTQGMRTEGRELYRSDGDELDIWQAMLAAAPKYEVQSK
jgi:hypothetical protein